MWRVLIEPMLAGGLDVAWGELAPDERARAERFHFEPDRRRFVAARVALRRILAGYLGTVPAAVTFTSGPHGKPELAGFAGQLRFSTARSGEVALVAVACGAEVGVDVEVVDPDFPWHEVAPRVFTSEERQSVEVLGQVDAAGFVRAWARKEAWAKATGLGIAHVLDGDQEIPKLRPVQVLDLVPLSGHLGAVAVEGASAVERWDLVRDKRE